MPLQQRPAALWMLILPTPNLAIVVGANQAGLLVASDCKNLFARIPYALLVLILNKFHCGEKNSPNSASVKVYSLHNYFLFGRVG